MRTLDMLGRPDSGSRTASHLQEPALSQLTASSDLPDELGMPCELLTVDQVAHLLKVARITVYRLVQHRTLPFVKFGGVLRFRMEDVAHFLARARVESVDV